MSGYFRPRNLVIIGGIAAGVVLLPRSRDKLNPVGNPFETPAVKSVGNRAAAGGGDTTHTPGVATPRGTSEDVVSPQAKSSGSGSATHAERMEPRGEQNSAAAKAFNQAHSGSDKGK